MTQPPTGASYGRPAPCRQPGSRPAPYGGATPQGAPGQYDSVGYGRVDGGRSNDGRSSSQQPSAPPVPVPVAALQGVPEAQTPTLPARRPGRAPAVPVTDRLVRRTAATGSGWIVLVLCGAVGLLFLASGLKTIVGGGDDSTLGLTMLIAGLILLVPVPMMMSMRTEFDSSGIHTRVLGFRRDIPWPRSRSDLFVKRPSAPPLLVIVLGLVLIVLALLTGDAGDAAGVSLSARAYVRVPQGRAVWLPGLTRRGLSRSVMVRRGDAELDRIWTWAVARGYTQETGTPARS